MAGVHRWCALLFVVVTASQAATGGGLGLHSRQRRNIVEMGQLVSKENHISLFQAYAKYNGYGCYCGLGGSGTPIDETDRCCETHDACFDAASTGACRSEKSVYNIDYKYTEAKTASPSGHALITCELGQSFCTQAICLCDEQLALCFSHSQYNAANRNYDRTKCN